MSLIPPRAFDRKVVKKKTRAAVVKKKPPPSSAGASPAKGINNNNSSDDVVRQAEYRLSPRVLLQAGDKIKVSGGPYYKSRKKTGKGTRMKVAEKGVMVFLGYCESGTIRWIEAHGKAGLEALHIGPEEVSSEIPGLVRRPYKITKVRVKNRPGGSAQPRRRTKAGRPPARPRSRKARLQSGI